MNKNKKSILWKISKEELLEVANNSQSINQMLRFFKLSGSAFYTLKNRLIAEGFDLSKFTEKIKIIKSKPNFIPKSLSEYMVENSEYSRGALKVRLIKEKIIPYICDECKCEPVWNDKKLVLILDHINGIRNDHRKENLRFLCPNCNSQTDTFAGKNQLYKGKTCSCGEEIYFQSNFCKSCSYKNARKTEWPTKEELYKLLQEKPVTHIALQFKVSDKSVARWIKNYGLVV